MSVLDRLERKLRRFAISNVTLYIIMGQVFFFVMSMTGRFAIGRVLLVPEFVRLGQWWRLVTFLFVPPTTSVIFVFFAWYLFYIMGSALEHYWGAFRYNLFLLTGYVATVAVSFVTPFFPSSNLFLGGSVFLAFAYLNPDFLLYIFFILPVRIKWLALVTWLWYGYQIVVGSWTSRLLVLASVANFLLFFGKDIYLKARYGGRRMAAQAAEFSRKREPFHTCAACGKTDISHPAMEFRYCPECGGLGYCMDHISNHEHVKKK